MCDDNNTILSDEIRELMNHTDLDHYTRHEFLDTEDVPNCPFCGETSEDGLELLETNDHETWFVQCDECLCQGPTAIDRDGAIEVWAMRDGK